MVLCNNKYIVTCSFWRGGGWKNGVAPLCVDPQCAPGQCRF